MSSSFEEKLARLEVARLELMGSETDKRIDWISRITNDTQAEIEPGRKINENILLTVKSSEFVKFDEIYADTLELAANQAQDVIPLMKEIQRNADLRESRHKEALELCMELMKNYIPK